MHPHLGSRKDLWLLSLWGARGLVVKWLENAGVMDVATVSVTVAAVIIYAPDYVVLVVLGGIIAVAVWATVVVDVAFPTLAKRSSPVVGKRWRSSYLRPLSLNSN